LTSEKSLYTRADPWGWTGWLATQAPSQGGGQGGQPTRLFYFSAPIFLRFWFCDSYFRKILVLRRLFREDFVFAAPISVRFWLCGAYISQILVLRRLHVFHEDLDFAAHISWRFGFTSKRFLKISFYLGFPLHVIIPTHVQKCAKQSR